MCDFNSLDETERQAYHDRLTAAADAFGGINFFLQLLEAIRKSRPHPLMAKNSEFVFSRGSVTWDKVIFKDKITLLMDVRTDAGRRGNLLPDTEDRRYKKVLNMVRTLDPITFVVTPRHRKDGDGFTLHPFKVIDDKTTLLDPLFDALFFCSVETVKRILTYRSRNS